MQKNDIGGVWRTIGGRRVFIKDGQSLESAMKESGKYEKKENRRISNEQGTKDFYTMTRKELITLLVDDQIKRGVIKPESKNRQIQARLSGSFQMSKTELINYAKKYL